MEAFQVNICLGISIYCVDRKEESLFWKLNLAKCVDTVDFPYVFLCWQRGSLGEKLGYTSSSSVVGSFPPFSVLCSSLCPLMGIRSQSSFCASQRHFSCRLGVWRCFHSQMLASGQPASMQLFRREMTYHRWLCIRGRPWTLSGHLRPCRFFLGHCVEQKVHSGSPVRCYGITWVNFWANPTLLFRIVSVELCPSHTKECFTGCRLRPPPWVDIRAVEIQAWILWAALLVFWCRFLLPGFPAQQTQGHCAYLSLRTHLVEDAAPPQLFPFWEKQFELSLVLLPSFFKLASVRVFSGERLSHLVWGRVHISGSHTGSLGSGEEGPNWMPRHVLVNLDTFLKTLSYLPSLKKVELLLKKKKEDEYISGFTLHFGRSSDRCSTLVRWQQATRGDLSWLLPTRASSLLWLALLGPLHPPDVSSRWPPDSSPGTVFSLLPICCVCILTGLLPIYIKGFFFKVCLYLFIWLMRS